MTTPARSVCRSAMLLAAGLLLGAAPLAAQNVAVAATHGDSTRIVPRVALAGARASLATRDRQLVFALLDTTIVLQLTDAGLGQLRQTMHDSLPSSFGSRMMAAMFGAALGEMFDRGIAVPLTSVRHARVDGTRLVVEGQDGKPLFGHVELNGRDMMNDFAPADAERFAALVNRAVAR